MYKQSKFTDFAATRAEQIHSYHSRDKVRASHSDWRLSTQSNSVLTRGIDTIDTRSEWIRETHPRANNSSPPHSNATRNFWSHPPTTSRYGNTIYKSKNQDVNRKRDNTIRNWIGYHKCFTLMRESRLDWQMSHIVTKSIKAPKSGPEWAPA